jgi:type IV secretory pathway VirJ component
MRMGRYVRLALLTVCCFLPAARSWGGAPTEVLNVAGFGDVPIYAPPGPPQAVVLFISGDGGWNLGVVPMAEALRDHGVLVAGVDIRAFIRTLDAAKGCAYPAGALEELSRTVQLRRHLAVYQ